MTSIVFGVQYSSDGMVSGGCDTGLTVMRSGHKT